MMTAAEQHSVRYDPDAHVLALSFSTAQAAKIDAACGEFVRLTPERLVEVCQELIELRKEREVR
jgi:ribosomal protein L18E